jgi:SAM-dependent methyltransferase
MNYDPLADLYDRQYRHYRDDLPFYTRLADDYGGPILELGAGTARVAGALARAGHEVVALEPAAEMIRRGQVHLAEAGLTTVTYYQGDMRAARLEQRFPLVIAPFNTLMHAYTFADQDTTLQTVRAHLVPGGRFAFDLYTPNFGELDVLRLEPEWRHVGGDEGELFLLQTHEPDTQLLTSHYFLDTTDENGGLRRQRFRLTQRYFHRFELERALLQNGFSQIQFYGDFGRGRCHARAPYLVCVAH